MGYEVYVAHVDGTLRELVSYLADYSSDFRHASAASTARFSLI